jgi:hypothetical protein
MRSSGPDKNWKRNIDQSVNKNALKLQHSTFNQESKARPPGKMLRCGLPWVLLLTLALTAASDLAQTASPKPRAAGSPGASPAPGASASPGKSGGSPVDPEQQKRYQATVAELQTRIGRATQGPMSQITSAENDLYIRFAYFKKPERLDPNSFANREELASWQNSLGELKAKEASVEKLYSAASDNLLTALLQQHITYSLADQIRKELVKTFPWDTIQKKELLMTQFIDAHGQLLTLFDKNWKTWNTQSEPGQPLFADAQVNAGFTKLREKIETSGRQIEDLFAKLKQ